MRRVDEGAEAGWTGEARRREGFEVRVFFWALGEAVYNLYVG